MLCVIPFKAASASACFLVNNLLCSSAFFFKSSTSEVASFNLETPPCKEKKNIQIHSYGVVKSLRLLTPEVGITRAGTTTCYTHRPRQICLLKCGMIDRKLSFDILKGHINLANRLIVLWEILHTPHLRYLMTEAMLRHRKSPFKSSAIEKENDSFVVRLKPIQASSIYLLIYLFFWGRRVFLYWILFRTTLFFESQCLLVLGWKLKFHLQNVNFMLLFLTKSNIFFFSVKSR